MPIKIDARIKDDKKVKKGKQKSNKKRSIKPQSKIRTINNRLKKYTDNKFDDDPYIQSFLSKLDIIGFDVIYSGDDIKVRTNKKNIDLITENPNINLKSLSDRIKSVNKSDSNRLKSKEDNLNKLRKTVEIQKFINEFRDINAYDSGDKKLSAFGQSLKRQEGKDIQNYTTDEIYDMIQKLKKRMDSQKYANPFENKRKRK